MMYLNYSWESVTSMQSGLDYDATMLEDSHNAYEVSDRSEVEETSHK